MNSKMQSRVTRIAKFVVILFYACVALSVLCAIAAAQISSPSGGGIIGQVTGDDVSVSGPLQTAPSEISPTFFFASGGTVVVHSGQARVQFTGGGELDVCGPAKFTVLASGDAITIAIDFGRIHAKLDPSRPVTIYTPLIRATPLAVMNQPRDITFGLEPNTGAMCVLAAHGALQVQQQLSGETLIVPEPSEDLLRVIPLIATPAAAGSCRCEFSESGSNSSHSETPAAQQNIPVKGANNPQFNLSSEAQVNSPATTSVESRLAEASRKADRSDFPPPVLRASKPRAPIPPPVLPLASGPILKLFTPPLFYDAKPLSPPGETISVAALLLAKEAIVQPEWIFQGQVAEPGNASGPRPAKVANKKPRKGFWAWFHKFLFGSPQKAT